MEGRMLSVIFINYIRQLVNYIRLLNIMHQKKSWETTINKEVLLHKWEAIFNEAHVVTNSNIERIQMEGNGDALDL